jgi:hypothetical protein
MASGEAFGECFVCASTPLLGILDDMSLRVFLISQFVAVVVLALGAVLVRDSELGMLATLAASLALGTAVRFRGENHEARHKQRRN